MPESTDEPAPQAAPEPLKPAAPTAGELGRRIVRSRIAGDLLARIEADRAADAGPVRYPVIVEGNSALPGGATQARRILGATYIRYRLALGDADPMLAETLPQLERKADPAIDLDWQKEPAAATPMYRPDDRFDLPNSLWTDYYLFGELCYDAILALAAATVIVPGRAKPVPLVYKLWLNHEIARHVFESVRTVKCDAALAAFAAAGSGIVWAVADTGIDGAHPHFQTHDTLRLPSGLEHHDFTGGDDDPLRDNDGHGTHVAGIIAGETRRSAPGAAAAPLAGVPTGELAADDEAAAAKRDVVSPAPAGPPRVERIVIRRNVRVSDTEIAADEDDTREVISGVAPRCTLLSLKVLESASSGSVALLLAAIGYVLKANDYGGNLRIHGLNLSLGYAFDARWFAAGRSPLCVEVDRLVRTGVVVVVAAGNGGYGTVQTLGREAERAAHLATISDPGNADLAITVGSTHRDHPHTYGVSYFSAKGPTADGRMKPDLVAPGERIISAMPMAPAAPTDAPYREETGTSMAAPHVSGAIAAFLSVRREFKGFPERVKDIFKASATDLGRQPEFQGAGLIDVMRALQSV